jgi:hypothetical protein
MSLEHNRTVLSLVYDGLKHVSFTFYLDNFYLPTNSLEYE